MSQTFEAELKKLGYPEVVDFSNDIKCGHDKKNWIFYYQRDIPINDECELYECPTTLNEIEENKKVKYQDFAWQKCVGCEMCVSEFLDVLICGGHYNNTRLFDIDNPANRTYKKSFVRGKLLHRAESPFFSDEEIREMIDDISL